MRTNEFSFKKTKRVKVVTEHAGISIDLTAQEAADLAELVGRASTPDLRFTELYDALHAFISKHGTKSDLSAGYNTFVMVKR